MFPALDVQGFRDRTKLDESEVDDFERRHPGWIARNGRQWLSEAESRLRKRYGRRRDGGSGLPFGLSAPSLTPAGTTPPGVTLTGIPTLGCIEIGITITTPGPVGTAVFSWTAGQDRLLGATDHVDGVVTAPVVALGFGLSAAFPGGAYAADNVYSAPAPYPEALLRWLVALMTWDVLIKRGPTSQQDPMTAALEKQAEEAAALLKESADGLAGLLDLPINDDLDSAQTTGTMQMYTENSPYVALDLQEAIGHQEDFLFNPFFQGIIR